VLADWRGACAQAASRINAAKERGARIVWVVILEMTAALALAAFIVWFTWPKKPPKDKDK